MTNCCAIQFGDEPFGTGHADDGSGLGPSTSDPDVYGGDRPADQSASSGPDRVLRTVHAFGTVTLPQYVNQRCWPGLRIQGL